MVGNAYTKGDGKMLSFIYNNTLPELAGLTVIINYEIYDNAPLIVKWLSIKNNGVTALKINLVVNEILATVEERKRCSRHAGRNEKATWHM